MSYVTKSSSKGAKANFVKSKGGTGVRAGKTDGGVRVGVTGCQASRAASNVKSGYSKSRY